MKKICLLVVVALATYTTAFAQGSELTIVSDAHKPSITGKTFPTLKNPDKYKKAIFIHAKDTTYGWVLQMLPDFLNLNSYNGASAGAINVILADGKKTKLKTEGLDQMIVFWSDDEFTKYVWLTDEINNRFIYSVMVDGQLQLLYNIKRDVYGSQATGSTSSYNARTNSWDRTTTYTPDIATKYRYYIVYHKNLSLIYSKDQSGVPNFNEANFRDVVKDCPSLLQKLDSKTTSADVRDVADQFNKCVQAPH